MCLTELLHRFYPNGRSNIELVDVALSILSEQKTHANFFLPKGGVDKESFADYVTGESVYIEDGQLTGEALKALRAFTNLNDEGHKRTCRSRDR